MSVPPEKELIIVGVGTLPHPICLITAAHHDMDGSCCPCGLKSTLWLKFGTLSKKKLQIMDENMKFFIFPYLQSINWIFMLANSKVHQS
jgi:hypothetical protein